MESTIKTTMNAGMTLESAQQEMRQGYLGGGTAMLVSGIVWLVAAVVSWVGSPTSAIFTLFIGAALIFPLGSVLARLLGHTGRSSKSNPLEVLALETTVLLFIGFFVAIAAFQVRQNWFFPIMLLMIGGRYILFATLYGMRLYWVLGLILMVAGGGLLALNAPFVTGAFVGGAIEGSFSIIIMLLVKRMNS